MSSSEGQEEQRRQDAGFPATRYEAAEEERRSLEQEQGKGQPSISQQQPEMAQRPRSERRKAVRHARAGTAGGDITLYDLDKQLDRQRRLMERGR
jgi:hypothetical protein